MNGALFRASLGVRGWTQDVVGAQGKKLQPWGPGEAECRWTEPSSASQACLLLPSQRLHVLTPGLGKQAETSFSLTTCIGILVLRVWL